MKWVELIAVLLVVWCLLAGFAVGAGLATIALARWWHRRRARDMSRLGRISMEAIARMGRKS